MEILWKQEKTAKIKPIQWYSWASKRASGVSLGNDQPWLESRFSMCDLPLAAWTWHPEWQPSGVQSHGCSFRKESGFPPPKWVFHWFTSGMWQNVCFLRKRRKWKCGDQSVKTSFCHEHQYHGSPFVLSNYCRLLWLILPSSEL